VWLPKRDDAVRERLEPALLPRRCRVQQRMSPRLHLEQRHRLSQRRDDLDVGRVYVVVQLHVVLVQLHVVEHVVVLVEHDLHGTVQPHHALHESRRLHGLPRLVDLRFRLLLRPVRGLHLRVDP
jgi:hypothetical protein